MKIADALDYAILKPLATREEIKDGCVFATKHKLKAVCVSSCNVRLATKWHNNVCSVIGFPHGNMAGNIKFHEAFDAIINGAKELDIVINYGRFLDGDLGIIKEELLSICNFAKESDILVKAILESCHYTIKQLEDACKRCADIGVDFVKTSTGFGFENATTTDILSMINAVKGTKVQVKASGGIDTNAKAMKFLDLGCTRLGSSKYLELLI